jgi:hypothetical protein
MYLKGPDAWYLGYTRNTIKNEKEKKHVLILVHPENQC